MKQPLIFNNMSNETVIIMIAVFYITRGGEKMKTRTKKELLVIAVVAVVLITLATVCVITKFRMSDAENVQVTQEEMTSYREMIGDGMVEKRAVFILFNTAEECQSFIDSKGGVEHPEAEGQGVVPLMDNDYHNIVGKTALEEAFDTLKDGDYSKSPVEYAGKFCYLKRISSVNPIDDDESLKEIIIEDKNAEKQKGGNN